MRLIHRGVTVDMRDDDVRVALIEALVFSTALPMPLTVGLLPLAGSEPEPELPPVPEIPEALRRFWRALPEQGRRELRFLAGRGRVDIREIERAVGVERRKLSGLHSRLSKLLAQFEVALSLKMWGKDRETRSYELRGEAVRLIEHL